MALNIVLDLDRTLVDTDDNGVPVARPHLGESLHRYFDTCSTVNTWTMSTEEWSTIVHETVLKPLLRPGDEFHFTWNGKRSSRMSSLDVEKWQQWNDEPMSPYAIMRYKPLWKMWRRKHAHRGRMTRDNTLIVDDSTNTYIDNYGNALGIKSWTIGENDDTELLKLADLIDQFKSGETVREFTRRVSLL